MKKYLIILATAFVLCVPAFATNGSYFASTVSFDDGVDSYVASFDNTGNGYFAVDSGDQLIAVSEFPSEPFNILFNGRNTFHYNVSGSLNSGYYFSTVGYITMNNLNPDLDRFPANASYSDIASAFTEYLNNSGGGSSVGTSFTVPRGNVLYFQVSSNSDVTFESHFSENSGLFSSGNVYGPWGDTYQRISPESSLPGPGIEFPRAGSSAIVWEKGDPLNVLGQTKTGVFTDTFQTGTYYAFYNPAYQSITSSDGFGSASVGSNVTVSGNFSFIRIYSLQQIYDISTSTNDYDDYYVGTPDGDGGVTWVDQDDQVSYPSSGGENQEDEPISSISLIESIKRILRNILSEIESIFTFGFSAIRDLVDLMDEFVATFDDLYEWLPEECYTLLIACVSVAIAIGVFKVFL